MRTCLLLCCLASLLVCTTGLAQPCHPDTVQRHIQAFWDRFKQTDTFPISLVDGSHKLYKAKGKQLFFMGSFHSTDIGYPLYRKIDAVIADMKPDVILVENYLSAIYPDIQSAVANGADVGYVSFTGRKHHIRIKSWDNLPEVYNQLIPVYGYDTAWVLLLNSIGDAGVLAQGSIKGYNQFAYGFQLRGCIVTPAQQSYQYYQKIFQQYFKQPLLLPGDSGYSALQTIVLRDRRRRQFDSRLTQLRDSRLLQVVQAELSANKKVYLQAGAGHFLSLQHIIPCYLKPSKTIGKTIRTQQQLPEQRLLTTHDESGNTQQVMIDFVDYADSSVAQRTRTERQLQQFAPELVLTSSPAAIGPTLSQTYRRSGLGGYTRSLAIGNHRTVGQWAPAWGDVYDHFRKSYSHEDLYMTCFAMLIAQDGACAGIDEWRDRFYTAVNIMDFSGYPFQPSESKIDFLIGRLVKEEAVKQAYTLEDLQAFLNSKKNPLLEAAIKKYQVDWLLHTPHAGLQNIHAGKIYIQMDVSYRACF